MRDILLCGAVVLIDICLVEIVSVEKVAAMRVAGIDGNTSFEIRGESNRQSIVPAAGNGFRDRNITQLRIFGIKRTLEVVVRTRGSRWGLVNIGGVVVIYAANIDVPNIENHAGTK